MAASEHQPSGFIASSQISAETFDFQKSDIVQRAPRGWERAPRSPFKPHLKGRKVWKRYNLRLQHQVSHRKTTEEVFSEDGAEMLRDEDSASRRAIKRRCLDGDDESGWEDCGLVCGANYLGTLWEKGVNFMRRKMTERMSAEVSDLGANSEVHGALISIDDDDHEVVIFSLQDSLIDNLDAEDMIISGWEVSSDCEDNDARTSTHDDHHKAIVLSQQKNSFPIDLDAEETIISRREVGSNSEDNGAHASIDDDHHKVIILSPHKHTFISDHDAEEMMLSPSSDSEFLVEPSVPSPKHVASEVANEISCGQGEEVVPTSLEDNLSASVDEDTRPVVRLPGTPRATHEEKINHRLSDTTLLKDFLIRTNARKEAAMQTSTSSPAPNATSSSSPPNSPRKVLAEIDTNPQAPCKDTDAAEKPAALPAIEKTDASDHKGETMSCRRSTRNRASQAIAQRTMTPINTRSCLAVRRPNGDEPVVLQKSEARELADLTKLNTKKNQGNAKWPKATLVAIDKTEVVESKVGGRAKKSEARNVSWDEQLTYVREFVRGEEEEEEQEEIAKVKMRPPVKKLGGAQPASPAAKPRFSTGRYATSRPKRAPGGADEQEGTKPKRMRERYRIG